MGRYQIYGYPESAGLEQLYLLKYLFEVGSGTLSDDASVIFFSEPTLKNYPTSQAESVSILETFEICLKKKTDRNVQKILAVPPNSIICQK